jgi:Zn-dependent peptidase ImmA (M78 family)
MSPEVLEWLVDRSGKDVEEFREKYAKWDSWLSGDAGPTLRQARELARTAGLPIGYLLLARPPRLELPVPDFREGFDGDLSEPSSDLLAVVHQSIRRQDWYRDFAEDNGLSAVGAVGSGAGQAPVVGEMRAALRFDVSLRTGSWSDVRKHLLRAFEDLGGLTVATSMVENNTHRLLDPDEFRGFTLIDALAPLIFVNTRQTLNGQIFTLAHEFAHVWAGQGGVSLEDPQWEPQGEIERWCNAVASEFLVPGDVLAAVFADIRDMALTDQLDRLARIFKCGTLVVLQRLRQDGLRAFADFEADYQAEVRRLLNMADDSAGGGGGDHYNNQPFRIGERFSRAIVADALNGRTPLNEAIRLTSLGSLSSFDTYAERLGVA